MAMTCTLNIDKSALLLFQKFPKNIQRLLMDKARVLTTNPTAGAPLKGKYRLLRSLHLRIEGTAYRIIYQIFPTGETIVARLAGTRENIYKQLDEMKFKA